MAADMGDLIWCIAMWTVPLAVIGWISLADQRRQRRRDKAQTARAAVARSTRGHASATGARGPLPATRERSGVPQGMTAAARSNAA